MDSEFRKNIERLERAVEVEHEEQISGSQIAQTMQTLEEIEEKRHIVGKLRKRIKAWRWVLLAALFAWIVILLYACAAVIIHREPEIREFEVSYNLEIPKVDLNDVSRYTLDELASSLSGNKDFVDYLGSRYSLNDKPGATVVWSMDSLKEAISTTNRFYTVNGRPSEVLGIKKFVEVGCSVHHFAKDGNGGYQELPEDFYYNHETIQAGGLDDPNLSEYISSSIWRVTLEVYDPGDIDVEQAVLKVLQSRLYGDSMDGLAADIAGAFDECKVVIGDEIVDTTQERSHPKVIGRYNITITDHVFNTWVCTAKGVWYE